ncbi:MAG: hypothetical protein ABI193_11360 [Minicystis sp.]
MSSLDAPIATKLAPYRDAFRSATFPAVVVPAAIRDEGAEQIRAGLAATGLQPFQLAHRGRYAYRDDFVDGALFARLRAVAEHIAEAALVIGEARITRLVQGDYVLSRDDRAPEGRSLELTLDLSLEGELGGGEVCYTHRGQLIFVVPQAPGNLSIVARGPSIRRYERYLGHLAGEREIVRLRMGFRFG